MPQVYDPVQGRLVTPGNPGGPTPTGISMMGGTYVRGGNPNETVQGQMNSLLRDNGDFIQINERQAQQGAARRGLYNTTMAQQAGRQAAIAAAAPIASADAQLAAQRSSQNADNMNAIQVAELARQAATAHGSLSGTMMIDSSQRDREEREWRSREAQLDRDLEREGRTWDREDRSLDREWESEESALDRGMTREEWNLRQNEAALDRGLTREEWDVQRNERALDRTWEREEADADRRWQRENMSTQAQQDMFRSVFGTTLSTLLSDPAYFRDPAASSGLLNFMTGQFGTLWSRFFGGGGGAGAPTPGNFGAGGNTVPAPGGG